MVKAYQKQNASTYTEFYCPYCDEWDEDHNWTFHTVYKYGQYDRWRVDDNDSDYFFGDEGGDQIELASHDSCDQYYESYESREAGNWVCGGCNKAHSDQDSARYCCT